MEKDTLSHHALIQGRERREPWPRDQFNMFPVGASETQHLFVPQIGELPVPEEQIRVLRSLTVLRGGRLAMVVGGHLPEVNTI